MIKNDDRLLNQWQAAPHRFGVGKVHAIDNERASKTFCGLDLTTTPGEITWGKIVNCKTCASAPERRDRAEAARQEWERIKDNEEKIWRMKYCAHLKSEKWRSLRERVLTRANGVCEGCALRPAVQVHHLTYQHLGDEFLWELRAICLNCHHRVHEGDEQ